MAASICSALFLFVTASPFSSADLSLANFAGADHLPVVFPTGKQRRRNAPTMAVSNILRYISGRCILAASKPRQGQYGSAQKIFHLGRRRPGLSAGDGCSGGAAALGSPFGRAGERSASLRGFGQFQIRKRWNDSRWVPSQTRLSAVPALPKGEPRGGHCPPGCFPKGKTTSAQCTNNALLHISRKMHKKNGQFPMKLTVLVRVSRFELEAS